MYANNRNNILGRKNTRSKTVCNERDTRHTHYADKSLQITKPKKNNLTHRNSVKDWFTNVPEKKSIIIKPEISDIEKKDFKSVIDPIKSIRSNILNKLQDKKNILQVVRNIDTFSGERPEEILVSFLNRYAIDCNNEQAKQIIASTGNSEFTPETLNKILHPSLPTLWPNQSKKNKHSLGVVLPDVGFTKKYNCVTTNSKSIKSLSKDLDFTESSVNSLNPVTNTCSKEDLLLHIKSRLPHLVSEWGRLGNNINAAGISCTTINQSDRENNSNISSKNNDKYNLSYQNEAHQKTSTSVKKKNSKSDIRRHKKSNEYQNSSNEWISKDEFYKLLEKSTNVPAEYASSLFESNQSNGLLNIKNFVNSISTVQTKEPLEPIFLQSKGNLTYLANNASNVLNISPRSIKNYFENLGGFIDVPKKNPDNNMKTISRIESDHMSLIRVSRFLKNNKYLLEIKKKSISNRIKSQDILSILLNENNTEEYNINQNLNIKNNEEYSYQDNINNETEDMLTTLSKSNQYKNPRHEQGMTDTLKIIQQNDSFSPSKKSTLLKNDIQTFLNYIPQDRNGQIDLDTLVNISKSNDLNQILRQKNSLQPEGFIISDLPDPDGTKWAYTQIHEKLVKSKKDNLSGLDLFRSLKGSDDHITFKDLLDFKTREELDITNGEVRSLFATLDKNKKGSVSLSEFIQTVDQCKIKDIPWMERKYDRNAYLEYFEEVPISNQGKRDEINKKARLHIRGVGSELKDVNILSNKEDSSLGVSQQLINIDSSVIDLNHGSDIILNNRHKKLLERVGGSEHRSVSANSNESITRVAVNPQDIIKARIEKFKPTWTDVKKAGPIHRFQNTTIFDTRHVLKPIPDKTIPSYSKSEYRTTLSLAHSGIKEPYQQQDKTKRNQKILCISNRINKRNTDWDKRIQTEEKNEKLRDEQKLASKSLTVLNYSKSLSQIF